MHRYVRARSHATRLGWTASLFHRRVRKSKRTTHCRRFRWLAKKGQKRKKKKKKKKQKKKKKKSPARPGRGSWEEKEQIGWRCRLEVHRQKQEQS